MELQLIGKTLGPYELVELAGEGGMATVYKAYQASLERWVAIKVLHTTNPELLARFEREAKTVAKLHHPNILPVYEYGLHEGWPYIVMQLIEQGTLKESLAEGPLEPIRVANLTIPIAEALYYAHGQGLIHRDIKPSNILMPRDDWPLLADFGLVKVKNPKELLTISDMALGTPSYMSPEQVMGKKVDLRADIYSLGVMMFEMTVGRLPFEYKNLNMMMLAQVSEQPPNPSTINPHCPQRLEQIILKALRKSSDDRYADMEAVVKALKTFVAEHITAPVSSSSSSSEALSTAIKEIPRLQPNRQAHPTTAQLHFPDQNISLGLPDSSPSQEGLLIGRSRDDAPVDIDLNPYGAVDAGISRQHARLIKQEEAWLLKDLSSTNGTFVNETKLIPDTPLQLRHGDEVRFGLLSCVFLSSPET